MSDVKRNEHMLPIANWLRDQINETLSRYDIPSDVYDADILIDALCVCAVDKAQAALRARLEDVKRERDQWTKDALREEQRAERDEAAQIMMRAERDGLASMLLSVQQDSIAATKALATARRDALEEAARIVDAFRVELHTSVPAVEHSDTDALTFAADRIRALIAQEQDATP